MPDAFALLRLPRRLWLETDEVRAAFQGRAAELHPDRAGQGDEFAEITRAYETLRDPASRLRYWLNLEQPGTPIPAGVPPDLLEWFPRVAGQLAALKQAAQRKAAAASPLAAALAMGALKPAEDLRAQIAALREAAYREIRAAETAGPSNRGTELAALAGRLAFLDKWAAQLGEGLLALRM